MLAVLSTASLVAWIVAVATSKAHHPLDFWLVIFFALLAASFFVWGLRQRRATANASGTHYHFGDRSVVTFGAEPDLEGWLAERQREMDGLKQQLAVMLTVGSQFVPLKAKTIEGHFWDIAQEVHRRLVVDAPSSADYFEENPTGFPQGVTLITSDQFRDYTLPAMDATIQQISHIRGLIE